MSDDLIMQALKKIQDVEQSLAEHNIFVRGVADKWDSRHESFRDLVAEGTSAMNKIASSVELLTAKVIDGAIGKRQVPEFVYFITVTLLGAIIISFVLRDSDKEFKVNSTGMSVTNGTH